MPTDDIEIEITGREAKLILEYGYPQEAEEEKLRDISRKSGCHKVQVDGFWLEMILGDLCRSIKETKNRSLQLELDELCEVLEGNINANRF